MIRQIHSKALGRLNQGLDRLTSFYYAREAEAPITTNLFVGAALGAVILGAEKVGMLDAVYNHMQNLTDFSAELVGSAQTSLQSPELYPGVEQFCPPDILCNPLLSASEQLISR